MLLKHLKAFKMNVLTSAMKYKQLLKHLLPL